MCRLNSAWSGYGGADGTKIIGPYISGMGKSMERQVLSLHAMLADFHCLVVGGREDHFDTHR